MLALYITSLLFVVAWPRATSFAVKKIPKLCKGRSGNRKFISSLLREKRTLCYAAPESEGLLILDINLESGGSEPVVLNCEADIRAEALRVTKLHFGNDQKILVELQKGLQEQWNAVLAKGIDAVALETHPIYAGPIPTGGVVAGIVATIELPDSGLILEVGESVSPDAGLGLFVRCSVLFNTDGSIAPPLAIIDAGTPLCGYAVGEMQPEADNGGKSVKFGVSEDGAGCVWFESKLIPLRQVLQMPGVHGLAGHDVLTCESTQKPKKTQLTVKPIDGYKGAKYFVPSSVSSAPMDILSIGCMANDLAYSIEDGTAASYINRSKVSNILSLVQRLELDPSSTGILRPSRPIPTISKPVSFTNYEPMEIGCEYGDAYWGLT